MNAQIFRNYLKNKTWFTANRYLNENLQYIELYQRVVKLPDTEGFTTQSFEYDENAWLKSVIKYQETYFPDMELKSFVQMVETEGAGKYTCKLCGAIDSLYIQVDVTYLPDDDCPDYSYPEVKCQECSALEDETGYEAWENDSSENISYTLKPIEEKSNDS